MKKIIPLIAAMIFIAMLPSVVSLVVETRSSVKQSEFTIEDAVRSSVTLLCYDAEGNRWSGSGSIISGDGTILTASHVVQGASGIYAITSNGRMIGVSAMYASDIYDVGFCRLDEPFECIPFQLARHAPRLEDRIRAVGSPDGLSFAGTVTRGIVSYRHRKLHGNIFMQVDAGGYPGSSGCPVINEAEEIVGVLVEGYAGGVVILCVPLKHIQAEYRHYCELWGK